MKISSSLRFAMFSIVAATSLTPAFAAPSDVPPTVTHFSQKPSDTSQQKLVADVPDTGKGALSNPFPSSVLKAPPVPLSSQKMEVNGQHISEQVEKAQSDADARLADVHIGEGDMTIPKVPDLTLRSDIATEGRIHQMEMKSREVKVASELWGSSYDGKRELEQSAKEAAQQTQQAQQAQPVASTNNAESEKSAREKRLEEAEDAKLAAIRQQEEKVARVKAMNEAIAERRRSMGQVPPVVSSIYGPMTAVRATILIPYVGVHNTYPGDTFKLIDGTVVHIDSIDSSIQGGVYATIGKTKSKLDFGSSVPTRNDAINDLQSIAASFLVDDKANASGGGNLNQQDSGTRFPTVMAPSQVDPTKNMPPQFKPPSPQITNPAP